jgi:hypothetical protein
MFDYTEPGTSISLDLYPRQVCLTYETGTGFDAEPRQGAAAAAGSADDSVLVKDVLTIDPDIGWH